MLAPLNITGGTYKHRSLPLSAQVTRNFWPQKIDNPSAKSPYILQNFYGMSLFGSGSSGVDRGMFEHKGVLYKVTGTSLYSVSSAGTHTSLGTISGTGRCVFAGIGSDIVVVAEGVVYVWDGTTLTTVSDIDLETPSSVAHLNNQIIYDGDEGRFATSDVGDASSINSLNYATAESNADDLLRVYVHNQILYNMGEKTIEPWYNSGIGNPPFDRIEGGIIQIGLQAVHSAANSKDYLYILAHDNQVYAISGTSAQVVSTLAIAKEIAGYTTKSDAIGFCMCIEGQWMYKLTFPTENKTFIYIEGGDWFEWSSGVSGGRSRANSYAFVYGKHLVGDFEGVNIYQLSPTVYTENSNVISRVRDTGPLHGGMVGKPGKTVEINRFELILETGVGIATGQGSDPVVMLSVSNDGGRTFSTEMWGTVGKMANYLWKVEWFALGTFDSCIFRIKITDPVAVSIHSAAADVEIGI